MSSTSGAVDLAGGGFVAFTSTVGTVLCDRASARRGEWLAVVSIEPSSFAKVKPAAGLEAAACAVVVGRGATGRRYGELAVRPAGSRPACTSAFGGAVPGRPALAHIVALGP